MTSSDFKGEGRLDEDEGFGGGCSRSSSLDDSRVLESEDSGFWESPLPGLEYCNSAPVRSNSSNLLYKDHDVIFSRSKTLKKDFPKYDFKLDRLSESEKKKIIENLVKIQKDGTLEVDVSHDAPVPSELLELDSVDSVPCDSGENIFKFSKIVPTLKIAILVVGTRGDVQPFIAIAKRLQVFGHRVRLATHVNFRNFVQSHGIEFYPLGGDPRIMAGYMARNKGFLLSGPAEISIQLKQLKEIIHSLLPACTEPDLETGACFKAQAIIANPPAYGHAHVAEALGVPLHIFFTMPWTPTNEFPHPMARVPQSAAYKLSYILFDLIVWLGIRGFINDFRKRKLNLPPVAYYSTYYGSISHLPTGYMWSPHLVPKPKDWGGLVDVVGFCFLNLGTKYQPQKAFAEWIQQGPKPIYVGFGSMPIEDGKKIVNIILVSLKETGQRGIIGRGWGDLGINDCPHDWLFPQCAAVVHHGGAGTTATGLRSGCPTTIIPFFGDQFFWGDRVHKRGVGPAPIPIYELSVERLSNAIRCMLEPEVKLRAMELAREIENENGVKAAVDAFHKHLPPELPIPPPLSDDPPCPLQWLFQAIERWCCLPFTS
ncbi:sterol 3-beta-glucosyltransferase UGT80B1-like isoform X2 [Asparagus officinalis]|uniref:sterol 3-beta-glucosyltransferase UGT80B1-like isoform X2 n=1 Tax=Asparagus officinalis TaxID=4686 RepID=UPI00098E0AE2|nr:sterol 3-beta-glucosyltransferase UGT80B1-like isoform X2 [Asparagus officinalis]